VTGIEEDGRWAEIDLGAIRANVRTILARLPRATRLLAVVKANGYGHGARTVAQAGLEAGAWGLAVSTLSEATALDGLCPPDHVLVLGGIAPQQAPAAAKTGCAITCYTDELIAALENAAVPEGQPVPIHLKVDTGMGRLGCTLEEAPALARRIACSSRLRLAGVFTHFASSADDEAFTREQLARFQQTLAQLDVDPGLRHACNSGAALRHPEMGLDAVRCGIALYGCEWPGLQPALRLRALVVQVKDVPTGATIGYGRSWEARQPSRIATVAIGYEDGVFRSRSNRGAVVVCGQRAPLVGRVSMDHVTIDVSAVPGVQSGDTVTLIGEGITAEEVAVWSGTISYEVLTSIGGGVRRAYI
jgi:alanine racemase